MPSDSSESFIGREEPLQRLRTAVGEARSTGRGKLFLVSGEPGIGKTRLAEEVEKSSDSSGLRVLWGRCHETGGRPPYWPWLQAFQSYVRAVGVDAVAPLLGLHTKRWTRFLPEMGSSHVGDDMPSDIGTESTSFPFFLELSALLARFAAERPLLIILDDMHWADAPSLRLLEFLAQEIAQSPIVLVVTYRDVDLRQRSGLEELVAKVVRLGEAIALQGFDLQEVADFVESVSGTAVAPAAAARLRATTDGNPFFLDEILRLPTADGVLSPGSDTAAAVPHGVRGTILQRLSPLPAASLEALRAAAVVGREFDLSTLGEILAIDRSELLHRLTPAAEIEIIRPVQRKPGGYRFSHALIRQTLRESLDPLRRAELHRHLAEGIERRHADDPTAVLDELAHHFAEAAGLGLEAKALAYNDRAGQHAFQMLAFEDAVEHFRRALHFAETLGQMQGEKTGRIWLMLGDALNRAGEGEESRAAFERAAAAAREAGAVDLLALAAIGLCSVGTTWTEYGRSDPALVAILKEALDALPEDALPLRAQAQARLATELYWATPPVDTDAMSREAVEIARRTGDTAIIGYTLPARIRCISDPDHADERRALVEELLQHSDRDSEIAVHARLWQMSDALQLGDIARVEGYREQLIRVVKKLRQPRDQWLIPALRGQSALLEGRFDEAEAVANELLASPSRHTNSDLYAVASLFFVRREQGRGGELTTAMRDFAYASETATVWRAALALVYAETGETEAAEAELNALVGEGLPALHYDNAWLLGAACLAEAGTHCGSDAQRRQVYEALLPHAACNVVIAPFFYMGPVAYYLGILALAEGDDLSARRHLDCAEDASRRVGAQPFLRRVAAARERIGSGATPLAPTPQRTAGLHCVSGVWELGYEGRRHRLKGRKGFEHLAELLAAPGRELHVLELSGALAASTKPTREGNLGPLLDERAKREMGGRLRELREDLVEAESHNDLGRADALRAEVEAIEDQLTRALGLGGRDRRQDRAAERARAAVTKAIRGAIAQIGEREGALADLLSRTIRTGAFCSYVPLADAPLEWDIRR